MRQADDRNELAETPALQRWQRLLICLLVAFAVMGPNAHAASAQSIGAAIVTASDTAPHGDSCDGVRDAALHHCHASGAGSSACMLAGEFPNILGTAETARPACAGPLAVGRLVSPLLRPPKAPSRA